MMLSALRRATTVAVALLFSAVVDASTLASEMLMSPLAPGQNSRLSVPLPKEFAPDQELWIVYELVALSADADGDGVIGLEQAFEGVVTPAMAVIATFHADKMESQQSAGTIAEQLQQITGRREPEELQRLMGPELFAAYAAVTSGKGRVLGGRLIRKLPAPGTTDTRLLISVERATGMQPLVLNVTVGQGSLPERFQEKTEDSRVYKIGYTLGLMLFGWLVMRFFRRRRN